MNYLRNRTFFLLALVLLIMTPLLFADQVGFLVVEAPDGTQVSINSVKLGVTPNVIFPLH